MYLFSFKNKNNCIWRIQYGACGGRYITEESVRVIFIPQYSVSSNVIEKEQKAHNHFTVSDSA